MNSKLNERLATLVREHRWRELLRSLPPNEGIPIVFESVNDMNTMRTVAAQLNTYGEDPNRYSCSGINYVSKAITVTATPKEP